MPGTDRVFVIAEVGVNHNGSLDLACQLIDTAASSGADAVKFQTFRTDKLVSVSAPKAHYQTRAGDQDETQFAMLKKLELDEAAHHVLLNRCLQKGVQFLSTPFDFESLDFLSTRLDLPLLKLSSGDLTNAPLLLAAARTGKDIILSTGMSELDEVRRALGVLAFGYSGTDAKPCLPAFEAAIASPGNHEILKTRVSLLHCTSEYPAPFDEVNLRAMETLRSAFGLRTGYSDHTEGTSVSIAACALGATIIEKHVTLARNLPGPDHRASIEPGEFADMIASIRQVELAMGDGNKVVFPSEAGNRVAARRSVVASRSIRKGEPFCAENITVKRPGSGVSPFNYWDYLNKVASRDYDADEPLDMQ